MAYTRTTTTTETSRLGGITLAPDGSLHVAWDMVNELGGSRGTPGADIKAEDVPRDLTIAQLFEWAEAKIVVEQGERDLAEAEAIAAKVAVEAVKP